jgi:hypothetical protein
MWNLLPGRQIIKLQILVFQDMMPRIFVGGYQRLGIYKLDHEDWGSRFFRNVSNHLQDNTTWSHFHIRQNFKCQMFKLKNFVFFLYLDRKLYMEINTMNFFQNFLFWSNSYDAILLTVDDWIFRGCKKRKGNEALPDDCSISFIQAMLIPQQ